MDVFPSDLSTCVQNFKPLGHRNWSGLHQEHCVGSAPSVTQIGESAPAVERDDCDCIGSFDAVVVALSLGTSLRFEVTINCLFLLFILKHLFTRLWS